MTCPVCKGECVWWCQDCECEVNVDEEMVVSETASAKEDAEMGMQITIANFASDFAMSHFGGGDNTSLRYAMEYVVSQAIQEWVFGKEDKEVKVTNNPA